jgi:hypothetical protein
MICHAPARVNPVLIHDQEQRLSLAGDWRFRLDPDERGLPDQWHRTVESMPDRLSVPGCWQGQGFGGDGKDRLWDFNLEARVFQATYKGTGWYGRTFRVPGAWTGKRLWLNFGGAHPSAEVWLNGERLGENSLPFVPFAFDVTDVALRNADNEVVVRVHEKNREFGFAYSWQGNWSGLYRGVDLVATGPAWFTHCAVLPDVDAQCLRLRLGVETTLPGAARHTVAVRVAPVDGSQPAIQAEFVMPGGSAEFQLPVPHPKLWSPDTPNLYRVDLALMRDGEVCEARSDRVGFVKLEARGKQFCINGEPYYLRGTGDFISCPETGCPDTDRDRWRRKLKALRDYGYNYVRCQSYVYGSEYYDVADEVGLLVQSEMGMLGAWGGTSPQHVYQWPKPTPDNLPVLKQQWDRVVERDVCHPSANLYCMSNEYWGATDFPRAAWQCYHATKALKPSAFVIWTDGGYNKELPGDFVNHFVSFLKPEDIAALDKPLIQHEYHWWSSFPDVRLRTRYAGAMRPYAAEIAAGAAALRGQAHLLETYARTSQRLQAIEAKAKMELMRRDYPTLAGICHFNAMDANPSPQGIIDEFYERKCVDAAAWRETNGDTVILSSLGFDDRVHAAGESVTIGLFVSDFGHPSQRAPKVEWRLTEGGRVLASGAVEYAHEPFRTCPAGQIQFRVSAVPEPVHARLEASLKEGPHLVRNAWDLWLFPAAETLLPGVSIYGTPEHGWLKAWTGLPRVTAGQLAEGRTRVVLAERMDRELAEFMRLGGRVILAATEGLVRPHGPLFGYVKYFFTPPANYAPYEDGQNGTVIARHAMLGGMPHEGFADWQFFRMIDNAPPLDLAPLGLDQGEPVIRCIHRYPVCHPLAYLTEARWGRGGLILSALEFKPAAPEQAYLLGQLCRYAAGEEALTTALPLREESMNTLLRLGLLP